jgi:riboflavin synthase
MFTGIIEEVGTIRESGARAGGHVLRIACSGVIEDLQAGSSISVNGACLTAARVSADGFNADLSPETASRSTLARLPVGAPVNLERSLRMSARLEGHLVTGHVDGVGTVRSIRELGDFVDIVYAGPAEILRYVAEKGSIAVDGISLTVADVTTDCFRVAVIPETVRRTNISRLSVGDPVNIECDLVAKYVERLVGKGALSSGGITLEQLREQGYA